MVSHPADAHHHHVYVRLRRTGRHLHRWSTPAPLLYGRCMYVGLLPAVLHGMQQRLRSQPGCLRQGLFPSPHSAPVQHHQQPDTLRHPVAHVHTHLRLLRRFRQVCAHVRLCRSVGVRVRVNVNVVVVPCLRSHGRPARYVMGTHHHFAHHQIP